MVMEMLYILVVVAQKRTTHILNNSRTQNFKMLYTICKLYINKPNIKRVTMMAEPFKVL